ncbi:ATP-dependent endonuclease [Leptospira sp. WS4.C2]
MKINFFAVNNYRGISGGLENNKINFHNTNTLFIYGQNNVGKSTFLKAYNFFYEDTLPLIDDFHKKKIENEIEFEIEVILDSFDKGRIEKAAPKQKESYKKYLNNDILRLKNTYKKGDKGKVEKLAQTYNPATNTYESIGYGSIGLHSVFQSCLPKPIFIKAMPSEEETKSILNEILKAMAEGKLKDSELDELQQARQKIKELQDKMYNAETIQNYQDSVNKYFKRIFSDTSLSFKEQKERLAWTENKLGKDFDIEFSKLNSDGTVNPQIPSTTNHIGHGTIRTAIFTLLLMKDIAESFERQKGRKDYMVLFEEPELFLYPKIIKELRELIYQVSEEDLPYQILCASHSSAMIDLSKPKSSIIRLVKENEETRIYQINDTFLKEAKNVKTDLELKQEMYEVLRFNPYICESFYSDEVVLVEGPTEEIIIRAYLQEIESNKSIFILNCGSVTNIPFYQKVFSKFKIKYHVIFDTDGQKIISSDLNGSPKFENGIQGSISKQYEEDSIILAGKIGLLRVHDTTFEPAHQNKEIPAELQYTDIPSHGKPYNANQYWRNTLQRNLSHADINKVPIIRYLKDIIGK